MSVTAVAYNRYIWYIQQMGDEHRQSKEVESMWGQIFSTEWANLVAMVPLFIGSIITVGIIIERLLHFRPSKMYDQQTVDKVVEQVSLSNDKEAMLLVEQRKTL